MNSCVLIIATFDHAAYQEFIKEDPNNRLAARDTARKIFGIPADFFDNGGYGADDGTDGDAHSHYGKAEEGIVCDVNFIYLDSFLYNSGNKPEDHEYGWVMILPTDEMIRLNAEMDDAFRRVFQIRQIQLQGDYQEYQVSIVGATYREKHEAMTKLGQEVYRHQTPAMWGG